MTKFLITIATLAILSVGIQAQRLSLPGIFSAMRYQNTACDGDNDEAGTCLYENECTARKGTPIGRCANGFAACCSFKFTCGAETAQNETLFVNRQYPRQENETNTCQVTIKKTPDICQLRLDFEEFSLAQPDENGFCRTDSFMVRTTVGERLPIICGENAGQHIYVDMGQSSNNPVVLSIVTNGNTMLRKWKIKINMIKCNHLDMAPSGCLQYYRSPTEVIKSFNYGPKIENRARYLANLRYTTCIRAEENFCAIKWETAEEGSFQFGSPFDGRDSELSECSNPFPFFTHGKTGEMNLTQTSNGNVQNVHAQQQAGSQLHHSHQTSNVQASSLSVPVQASPASVDASNAGTSRESRMLNEAASLSSASASASSDAMPGVLSDDKDPLYPHRMCRSGATGVLCNFDDFIGIDQGSLEGRGQGEDRFCGSKLLNHDFVISRSKPFQLKTRTNSDHTNNAVNSQVGFALRYTQLPCVI